MKTLKSELLPDLGQRISACALARRIHKSPAWVKTHALELGAIPIGNSLLFFEKCIENRLRALVERENYANSTNQSPGQEGLARPGSFTQWTAQGKDLFHQARGLRLGSVSPAEIDRAIRDIDPEGLLPT